LRFPSLTAILPELTEVLNVSLAMQLKEDELSDIVASRRTLTFSCLRRPPG